MAFRVILMTICMPVCLYACGLDGLGSLGPIVIFSATSERPECQPDQLITCATPAMALAMTPEGEQLQMFDPVDTKISQIITENLFHSVCGVAQNLIACGNDWLNKCAPPEALTNIQVLSRAARKILSSCNETDSYSRFTKIANCGQKMIIPAQMCLDNVREIAERKFTAQMTNLESGNSSAALEEWGSYPTEFVLKRINLQKHACCYGKKIKECLAPVLNSGCTADEKFVTEKFMDRILRALECTDAHYRC